MDSVIRLSGNMDLTFSEFYASNEMPLKVAILYEAFWHICEQENRPQKDFFRFNLWGCLKGQVNLVPRAFSIFLRESLETMLRISH